MGIPLDWAGMWVFEGCRGYDPCWLFRYPPPQAGERVNGNLASRSICESAMAIPVSPAVVAAIYRDEKGGYGSLTDCGLVECIPTISSISFLQPPLIKSAGNIDM